jgi:hypothetical protein
MQYARLAKLSRITRKLPTLESKWVFLSWVAEMLFDNSSKISNSPSSHFSGKNGIRNGFMPHIMGHKLSHIYVREVR